MSRSTVWIEMTLTVLTISESSRKVQNCLIKLTFFHFVQQNLCLSGKCPVNLSKENNILTTNIPSVLQVLVCPAKDCSLSERFRKTVLTEP